MSGREYRMRYTYVLAPYCTFSESYMPGIKNLRMRALDSNSMLWVWPRVQADTSVISTENLADHQNASILHSPKKIKTLAPWAAHMHDVGSHVTRRKNITQGTMFSHY